MGDDKGWSIIAGLVGVFALMVGLFLGEDIGTRAEQQRAIEAGVGRWQIDGKPGERAFVYGTEGRATK